MKISFNKLVFFHDLIFWHDFLELTLQNCSELSERGFVHLATLSCLERLDFYRTNIEASALVEILKASPRLKHINLGNIRETIRV